ncbi:hypothetical protein [Bifidobacterium longum]|uniref:hypothetical protein n=2 Tax=Bifidobacterium longum TaxID=216816 RepID=UPI0010F0DDA8|nr:hypothetical protein [Bifidobacterium longum]TCE13817.1 hypothetical protein MCC10027_0979 [Bifidobacterium longum subsp. longum]
MVDSRKSLHAKQQRRRANGEFAEEQDTGLPSGDTLTDFERKRLNNAMLAAETNIIMDPDVADYSQYAASRLDELVARPAKPGETDDMPLIVANLRYDPMGADGSRADYLADHVQAAYDGVPVKARDRIQLAEETRQHILDTAVDPDKALRELGLRPVQPGEHVGGPDTPRFPGELAELRYQAALKGAQTKQARYDAASEKHLAPLNEQMLGLYKANVNRGLINGSAFDDKMAFADALHELQEDGWNPEKGKEYRQSKDFKKLEKQLLNGRKPTRRYRQLRDALCDNEREYRYFMESKPDVFDPNEKVEKPFAGLGPDVGQAAMLRLTAKHRGIEDAVRLARRDQSIEYTVADAKTHTFRSDHDELRMTYLSDGSPYKPEHTIITANGIKPASVMSWIHREKPGSPAWEQRARQRFIILFTCYTEYVHIEMKEETNEHHNQRPNQPSHRIRMGRLPQNLPARQRRRRQERQIRVHALQHRFVKGSPASTGGGECHERRSRIQGAASLGTTACMGPILPAPLHQQLGARQELCSPMLREARHHRSALKEKTMKSYKTYAEEYGLDIEVVRWVFNHIRVTRYVMSEPIGYKIAFKYLGQPVHLSSGLKTGVAEKSFREIVNIRRKAITTEANPELVPDKD